jgi:hypothetical protein
MTTELATQSPVNTVIRVRDESFYLDRFKKAVKTAWIPNGRIVDTDYYCEIYKEFAIVIWKQEIKKPDGTIRLHFNNYIWEVGSIYDNLHNLNWISQGCVSTGYGAVSFDKTVAKAHKKVDLLSLLYSEKSELQALSHTYGRTLLHDEEPIYNALIGDVVALRAFGRVRLGKIVKLTGSRFVVAYMTPSNSQDVHYKTLPLNYIYPRERKN